MAHCFPFPIHLPRLLAFSESRRVLLGELLLSLQASLLQQQLFNSEPNLFTGIYDTSKYYNYTAIHGKQELKIKFLYNLTEYELKRHKIRNEWQL